MRVLGFALHCCSALTALGQWQLVASGNQLPSAAFDGSALAGGDLAIATNTYSPPARLNGAFVVHISADGAIGDTVPLAWPSELTKALHIYSRGNGYGFYVTGYFSDSTAVGYENKCFVAEVIDGDIQYFRHGDRWHGGFDGLGFVDTDGSLVYGRYSYQDFSTLQFNFWATRHCLSFGACDSVLVNSQIGTGRVHAIVPLMNGSIAAIMPAINQGCSPSNDGIVILSQGLDTLGCHPIPVIETGLWSTNATFDDNLTMLVLPSGNLLLCGMYERIMSPDWWHPVAIQRLTPEGELLASRRFYNATNPAITMRPGIMRGMSPFDANYFAFAYSDNAWAGGPWPESTQTSNLHVLRMDTALNILGEFVFNGDAINRYHFLSSVVASPDGAVYVMGSVYDHGDDNPRPKAWVARVGPEQFVFVPEAAQAGFAVFPNPGSEGFNLRMANPIGGARLGLYDAQGRLLLDQVVGDAQTWINGGALPAGLYFLQITARDGSRFSARWVKE